MAVASGPAGLVLAGPVFTVIFGTAHALHCIMSNEITRLWGRSYSYPRKHTSASEPKPSQAHIWAKESCVPGLASGNDTARLSAD